MTTTDVKPNAMSLRDFLHITFKRKNQILIFIATSVCIITAYSLLVTPTYEANAKLLIKFGRENTYVSAFSAKGETIPIMDPNREEQLNSETEILKSDTLAEKVVTDLEPKLIYPDLSKDRNILNFWKEINHNSIQNLAIQRFQRNLRVEAIKKSGVIDVSFQHDDPNMAAKAVNSLVNLYIDHHLYIYQYNKASDFFKEQADILERNLTDNQIKLDDFKKNNTISSLNEERSLLLKSEADFRAALNQTASQQAELSNKLRELQRQLSSTPKAIPLVDETDNNSNAIGMLQGKLVELKTREDELRDKYTDQSPLMISIRNQIDTVSKKLADQETKRYKKSQSGINPIYQSLLNGVLSNEAELKALNAKYNIQAGQLAGYQQRLEKLNQLEFEMNNLQQRIDVDRQNYQLYLIKLEESRVSDAMDKEKISNVSLIDPARPPFKPIRPNLFLNILLGFIIGLIGGFGLAFFLEYLDDSLENEEDIARFLRVPVLGSIPSQKNVVS